ECRASRSGFGRGCLYSLNRLGHDAFGFPPCKRNSPNSRIPWPTRQKPWHTLFFWPSCSSAVASPDISVGFGVSRTQTSFINSAIGCSSPRTQNSPIGRRFRTVMGLGRLTWRWAHPDSISHLPPAQNCPPTAAVGRRRRVYLSCDRR